MRCVRRCSAHPTHSGTNLDADFNSDGPSPPLRQFPGRRLFSLSQTGLARSFRTVLPDSSWNTGFGYETSYIYGQYTSLQEDLTQGNTNVTMEVWLPLQQAWFDAAIVTGEITLVGKSLDDNWESALVIPQWVADEYPGLRTAQDLKKT